MIQNYIHYIYFKNKHILFKYRIVKFNYSISNIINDNNIEFFKIYIVNIIEQKLERDGLAIVENLSQDSWNEFNSIIHDELSLILNFEGKTHKVSNLNEKRLQTYRKLNEIPNWESKYASLGLDYIKQLLGPDILIQRKLNLSVQIPNDESSLLGVHADSLSGQSPFEIVMWTAFTDVYDTNGMFYFDRKTSKKMFAEMPKYETEGLDYLRKKYWKHVKFLKMKPGQIALFTGTIFHGNVVNKTNKPRVSINCRFKNLFSPQGETQSVDRGGSIFYKKLTESIITRIGHEYLQRKIEF